jgi:glycosyltransferase involved in cell wall biosynthesis
MISVVIPAHNEEKTIARCLSAILSNARPGDVEVVVVCNGSTDRTADVAARFGSQVRVIETSISSKARALNLGDSHASSFPRFYVDADVVCPLEVLKILAEPLASGKALAASPRIRPNVDTCSWAVRAFYSIYVRLPLALHGFGGVGVYGVSREGRSRFDRFPGLIADDTFVRLQFSDDEWCAPDCYADIFPPRVLNDLIRIKTRAHGGGAELRRLYPERAYMWRRNWTALFLIGRTPLAWPQMAVYLWVRLVTRLRYRYSPRARDVAWERDDTSR